ATALLLAACAARQPPPLPPPAVQLPPQPPVPPPPANAPAAGVTLAEPRLWREDEAARALQAFILSCPTLSRRNDKSGLANGADWLALCTEAPAIPARSAPAFFRDPVQWLRTGWRCALKPRRSLPAAPPLSSATGLNGCGWATARLSPPVITSRRSPARASGNRGLTCPSTGLRPILCAATSRMARRGVA